MKTALITLFALFVGLLVPSEESWAAKRLGGGTSSGMQRNVSPSTPTNTASAAPSAAATGAAGTAAQAGKRSWLGPIAGIAGAIGLAALFSSMGLGEEAANFMMILLLVVVGFVAVRWFLNRNKRPVERMSYAAAGPVGANVQHFEPAPGASPAAVPAQAATGARPLPEGIDPAAFVRQAKLNFIRLQTANDTANLDDIREFTTPEMYAEIAMQIEERGGEPQQTEVVTLNADILEFAEEGERQILSVRFHGLIREEAGSEAVAFDEAWHLVRPRDLSRHWLIAGIQQMA